MRPPDHRADDHSAPEALIVLTPAQRERLGITVATAAGGRLVSSIELPGQIVLNADREAHITPRVGGVVTEVRKVLGDRVEAGETLAVIESRELADLHADYLAATTRVALAEATHKREAELWQKKISAERDYLEAKQALAEARIAERQARQKLGALGFGAAELASLARRDAGALTRFPVVSLIAGTVVEKHVTLGEVAQLDEPVYTIADLGTVWIDLNVYPRDLPWVETGDPVEIEVPATGARATGRIAYVQPLADTETRAVLARIVQDNSDGRWRPGLVVTAHVTMDAIEVPVRIPRSAVQTVGGEPVVFLAEAAGFAARKVTLGRGDAESVEVVAGLAPGERYVVGNSFVLKAELGKGEAAHDL
jgi:cobalt-zinc-cadmium efflux system membrane fusion protein